MDKKVGEAMRRAATGWLGVLAMCWLCLPAAQAQIETPPAEKVLVVGTKEAPPFAMKGQDGQWRGISIELWEKIAADLHLRFRYVEAPTVPDLIRGTAGGTYDVSVAAITVTANRQQMVDFAQPFYTTGLGIAVSSAPEARWLPILRTILSFGFLQAILALVGIAMTIGVIVWLFERRRNPHFTGPAARGIGHSFWWSAIAMTQAGAAEGAPVTLPGRAVGMVWMVASIVSIAVFTAGITTAMTTRELRGVVHSASDLASVRVGILAGTASEEYMKRARIPYRIYPGLDEALRAVERHQIDAFVHDKPILAWYVREHFASTVEMVDTVFNPQTYGIALSSGSPLRVPITIDLLRAIETEWWLQTQFKYLGVTTP